MGQSLLQKRFQSPYFVSVLGFPGIKPQLQAFKAKRHSVHELSEFIMQVDANSAPFALHALQKLSFQPLALVHLSTQRVVRFDEFSGAFPHPLLEFRPGFCQFQVALLQLRLRASPPLPNLCLLQLTPNRGRQPARFSFIT